MTKKIQKKTLSQQIRRKTLRQKVIIFSKLQIMPNTTIPNTWMNPYLKTKNH